MTATATTRSDAEARLALWPDLTYRYGLSYDELRRMPNGIRRIYEEALPRLVAEDLSAAIDAASFPHMKKEGRQSIIRRLRRALDQGRKQEAEVITDGEQFTDRLLASGIAITAVDSEGNVIENVGVGGSRPAPDPEEAEQDA